MATKQKNAITKKYQWVVALLIAVGVAAAGYYGYVRTSADTFSSNVPPTVNCKNLTKKQCDKKQANSDAEFFAQLEKDCNAANRIYKDESCGNCQKGFYDKDGICKARIVTDCAAEHRFQQDDYTCGKCIGGYYDKNAVCTELAQQATPQANVVDQCARSTASPICQPTTPATPASPVVLSCGNGLHFDTTTLTCTCDEGYSMQGGLCQKDLTKREECALNGNGKCLSKDAVQKICGQYFLIYDRANNRCKDNCITGYYLTNDSCSKINKEQPATNVEASCAKQFLQYDKKGNVCTDKCVNGYVKVDEKCIDRAEVRVMTEQRCRALGRLWVPNHLHWGEDGYRPAACANFCLDGNNAQFVDTKNDITSYCRNDAVTNALGVSLALSQDTCAADHRIYLPNIKACSARCVAGWYLDDGECKQMKQPVTNVPTDDTEDGGCPMPLQNGTIPNGRPHGNDEVSICGDDTPTGPPAQTPADQPVKHNVETDISKAMCRMLGRVWVPDGKVKGVVVKGGCSTQQCLRQGAEARSANESVYCEGSVDRISHDACTTAHRVWLDEVAGCAGLAGADGTKRVNAPQCEAPYTVYVRHTIKQGADECIKPAALERLQSIAQRTGKPFAFLASIGLKRLCNLQNNKAWIDGKCVKKRIANVFTQAEVPSTTSQQDPALVSCSSFHELFSDYYCTVVPDVNDDRACIEGTLVTPVLKRAHTWFKPTSAMCKGVPLGLSGLTAAEPQDVNCKKFVTYFDGYRCRVSDPNEENQVCPVGSRFTTAVEQFAGIYLRSKACAIYRV